MNLRNLNIDKEWTLFLDRDGVINKKLENDYVKRVSEFHILPGVPEALKLCSDVFGKIIVVTNQQGVGKGLMSEADLQEIHNYLISLVEDSKGIIHGIFYSPYLEEENHITRKPNTGLAHEAKEKFPAISFRKSIMLGDSVSDMQFGRSLGMINILITDIEKLSTFPVDMFDFHFESLLEFSQYICHQK